MTNRKKNDEKEYPKVFISDNGEEVEARDEIQAAAFAKFLKEKE